MRLRFAYNTNGIANHRLEDALELLAHNRYDGVALTLDHHHLDPYAPDAAAQLRRFAKRLRELELGCVIETGARFLLDPRAKHEPTLVTADAAGRAKRLDFLMRALHVAAETGAEALSFWAGVPRAGVDRREAWKWLCAGVAAVAARAQELGVVPAFEPEPGMLVETVDDYRALARDLPQLRLALDTGHCLVSGEREPAAAIRETRAELGTVSIEDMRRGEHVHRAFGEGDMDVRAVLAALHDVAWTKLVCVELSRDAHRADTLIPATRAYLEAAEMQSLRV